MHSVGVGLVKFGRGRPATGTTVSCFLTAVLLPSSCAAGLSAIGTAKNMGAIVRVFDTRAAVAEQVCCCCARACLAG